MKNNERHVKKNKKASAFIFFKKHANFFFHKLQRLLCNWEEALGLVFKKHIVVRCETNASTKDVLDAFTLTSKSVDNRSASGNHGALEKVAEDGKDGSKTFRLLHFLSLVRDTGHELSQDNEIGHERSSKKRIFASVVDGNGVDTAHEDLRSVLIHSTLAVTDVRDVLDDNAVVRLLTRLVEKTIALNDIVDDASLGDFLRTELSGRAQVLTIVVTKVVVRDDGSNLETGANEEVSENALDLGLTALKVITSYVDTVALSQFDDTRDESVLRRAIDEAALLEDGGNSKHGGGSDFLLVAVDGSEELVSSLVETRADVSEALSGSSPEDDDLLETLLLLEVADIRADLLDELLVGHGAWEHVVSTIFLISSDKVREVDRAEGLHLGHDGDELALEIVVEHLGALEGKAHISTVDVPATDLEISWLDHGEEVMNRDIHLVTFGSDTQTNSCTLGDGAVEVGLALARARVPLETEAISQDTSSHRGTVVATPTNKHNTGLWNTALSVELEFSLQVLSDKSAIGGFGHTSCVIRVVRHNLFFGIVHIRRCYDDGSINL